jgi:hypothetical protein
MDHRKEFFALFREIDVKTQTKEDYTPTLSEQYEHVKSDNFEEYSRVACLQYEFIKENPNLSAFYFVDWRVEFSKLETYILNNVFELSRIETVKRFMRYYDGSGTELYKRLDLPDYHD